MTRRKGLLFSLCCLLCGLLSAQSVLRMEEKKFNIGAKIGLNATLPVINSLRILNYEANQFNAQYQVGYMAALFCRFNIQRFFIQPSPSWHYGRSLLDFAIPLPAMNEGDGESSKNGTLRMRTQSLEMPVLFGYHIVKRGPYGLSLMGGPKVKYNYKLDYNLMIDNRETRFANDDTPFGVNIVTGIGVSIGRFCFDFIYELGLNQTEANFKQLNPTPESHMEIQLNKRTNVMSMAVGILF